MNGYTHGVRDCLAEELFRTLELTLSTLLLLVSSNMQRYVRISWSEITQRTLELTARSNITVGVRLCVQEGFLKKKNLAGQLLLNFQISFFIAKVRGVAEFSAAPKRTTWSLKFVHF